MTATKREGGHTLGPWLAEGWDETEEGCAVIAVHEELGLCSPTRGMVAWVTTIAGASFESPGKAYANARLIAAAPDLLEALKSLLLTAYSGGLLVGEAHRMAEAAIAQATGAGHE